MFRQSLSRVAVRYRLLALLVISTVALLAVGVGGWFGMARLSSALESMHSERLPAVTELGEIRNATALLVQYSYETLTRERQANAQSRFQATLSRKKRLATGLDASMAAYEKLPKDAATQQAWKSFKEAMGPWRATNDQLDALVQTMSENDDPDKQVQLFAQYKMPLSSWSHVQAKLDIPLAKLLQLNQAATASALAAEERERRTARGFIAVSLIVAVVVMWGLAIVILRSITGPIERLRRAIVTVSERNDFTIHAPAEGRDELGETARAFNQLIDRVRASLRDVLDCTQGISSVAGQASATSDQVARSSTEQSDAAANMAAAIEEMTVAISEINDSMQGALGRAQSADQAAQNGAENISRSNAEMDRISGTVGETGEAIDKLTVESGKISHILEVIRDVAEQTNLLALNAAIEAARAGEQGRGFAVVADEVRKLAERTAKATSDIGTLVGSMRDSGRDATNSMSNASGQVASGKALSQAAVESMKLIRSNAQDVTGAINDVAASLQEQSETAHNIARQVEAVASLTEANSAAALETARVSKELERLSATMREAVSRFQV